eukprot:gnl/Hemi2/12449_TR4245_c0_g1_i1.p1 gnl/Hemi2/12449_TR4245_c0_g1~~gnl/Hemi2/12449_TR4245_c0_g1_i1.p1  ORF type:complete len:550 (+),score=133.09 gnl/Hemi2/12449_TR4245_c0_g1_i1:162-1652(+)
MTSSQISAAGFNVYEISTRPWLYELSQKYGREISTLADIPQLELQQLADAHIDVVWFMGLWHLGPFGLQHDITDPGLLQGYAQTLPGFTTADIIGSPYAVTEFTANPSLGSDSDVSNLRNRLHALGMKLMTDFVPNHTAVDSNWTSSNPEYYVRSPKGTQPPYDSSKYLPSGIAYGSDPYSGAWTDTAQLNYWNPDLYEQMTQALLHVASLSDYVRCDMAMLVINDIIAQTWGAQLTSWGYAQPKTEFWQTAIAAAKASYDVKFVAEVYWGRDAQLRSFGFDYTYDKDLLDALHAGNLDNIRGHISGLGLGSLLQGMHFTENHDEPRAISTFGGWQKADAAALVAMTLPGMRFYNHGQWAGKAARLDVHLRRSSDEAPISQVANFYTSLLNVTSAEVFRQGQWVYCDVGSTDTSWRLMAWRWGLGDERRVCIINFSDTTGAGPVVLPDAASPSGGGDSVAVLELLTGAVYTRSVHEMQTTGLFTVIDPWSAQIFKY